MIRKIISLEVSLEKKEGKKFFSYITYILFGFTFGEKWLFY